MRAAALLLCVGLAAAAPAAYAAGDAAAGRDLALTWCSSCHVVKGGPPASDAVPPLAAVAHQPEASPDRLRGFLAQPHGGMPPLHLTRQEIENLIAYMQSVH